MRLVVHVKDLDTVVEPAGDRCNIPKNGIDSSNGVVSTIKLWQAVPAKASAST